MKDKIVLITGATSGIGYQTALGLAKLGAHLILHGRDGQKLQAIQQQILSMTPHAQVDGVVADLFLLSDVRQLADTVNQTYPRLDVLINNAGVLMGNRREETIDGIEKTIALNLLAPYLLMGLLFSRLKRSPAARIINVSSSAHRQNARPDFTDWQSQHQYSPLRAYGNAKLFLMLISQHLSRQLAQCHDTHITVNTVHPGAVATNFSRESDLGRLLNWMMKLARPFFKSPRQGAETIIYLASSPEVAQQSGRYFVDGRPTPMGKTYNSIENEAKVWSFCERITGVIIR